MNKSILLTLCVSILLAGCSIVPYEDEYACNMPDSLGKCQDLESSYQEAVTGVETKKPMVPASQRQNDDESEMGIDGKQSAGQNLASANPSSYDQYIEDYYRQLQRLIVQPKHPVIREPTQVRMLVLPYSSQDQSVMYMARHIYWVHQRPQFILGDYMKKPAEILDTPMFNDLRE